MPQTNNIILKSSVLKCNFTKTVEIYLNSITISSNLSEFLDSLYFYLNISDAIFIK